MNSQTRSARPVAARQSATEARDRPFPTGRRLALASIAIAAASCLLPALAQAQSFPGKPVTIVLSYPAGGVSDLLARSLASQLQSQWKQPVLVDNRPGANQIIATSAVSKAAPDGYTLLMCDDGPFTLNPNLYSKLPYALSDFTPVAALADFQFVLSVAKELPIKSLADLVAYGKANPGKMNFASFGVGNITHVAFETFQRQAGIQMVHVPYKGYPPAIADVLSNQAQMVLGAIGGPVLQYFRTGALKPLAVTGAMRSPLQPDVPTFAEAGYPNFKPEAQFLLFGPAGLPEAVAQKIHTDVNVAIKAIDAGVLRPNGLRALGQTRAQIQANLKSGAAGNRTLVTDFGIKVE